MPEIPIGPARDRVVAEVVGWKWVEEVGMAWDAAATSWRFPGTSNADALAALEAWARKNPNRWYTINRWSGDNAIGGVEVTLYPEARLGLYFKGEEPTLPAAATAALVVSGGANG